MESLAHRSVRESSCQHHILPELHEGGSAVPVERELKDDDIRAPQELLLASHVDVKVGILCVEIVDMKSWDVRHDLRGIAIRARDGEIGVDDDEEDRGHEIYRNICKKV